MAGEQKLELLAVSRCCVDGKLIVPVVERVL
jgi:hypothetical protein